MFQLIIATFISVLFFPSNALAFLNIKPLPIKKQSQSTKTCVNLGGSWSGTCTSGGQTTSDEATLVQQGCEYFVLDGKAYSIGGTTTEVTADPNVSPTMSSTVHVAFSWADNQTKLKMNIHSIEKMLLSDSVIVGTGSAEAQIVNNQLVTHFETSDGTNSNCVYNRVN